MMYPPSIATVVRASTSEIRLSCIFSPGRIPVSTQGTPGDTASAKSTTSPDGHSGTKISPPRIRPKHSHTNSTPLSILSQNRVIRRSVMVSGPPLLACSKNSSTTDPRDPITFPYLTAANRAPPSPDKALAATNNFSAHSLLAPYKLIGAHALSDDSAMTRSTPCSIAAVTTFSAPITFVLITSIGLTSPPGTRSQTHPPPPTRPPRLRSRLPPPPPPPSFSPPTPCRPPRGSRATTPPGAPYPPPRALRPRARGGRSIRL